VSDSGLGIREESELEAMTWTDEMWKTPRRTLHFPAPPPLSGSAGNITPTANPDLLAGVAKKVSPEVFLSFSQQSRNLYTYYLFKTARPGMARSSNR